MKKAFEHIVIRTPSDTINVIGGGGINERTITECWGKPSSGKSAFAYNTATFFLDDYKDGIVKIIDSEISTDSNRLENTFMMDLDRVLIEPTLTLEDAYKSIFDVFKKLENQQKADITVTDFLEDFEEKLAKKLLDKADLDYELDRIFGAETEQQAIYELQKLANLLAYNGHLKPIRPTPVFIIWDTIAASKPAKEVEAALAGDVAMNAGGLGNKARINEANLSIVMTQLSQYPVTIFVLNQIRKTFKMVGKGMQIVEDTSSGGNVLKHNAHYNFFFKNPKKVYDDEMHMDIGTLSMIDVNKSKFGPTVKNIPIWIDDRMGGIMVQKEEAALMCKDLDLITHHHQGWYRFKGEEVNYRWEQASNQGDEDRFIIDNADARLKCIDYLARHFRKNYRLLDTAYKKLGIAYGELSVEDQEARDSLIKNFSIKDVLRNLTEQAKEGSNDEASLDIIESDDVSRNETDSQSTGEI